MAHVLGFFAVLSLSAAPVLAQSSSGFAEYFVPGDEVDIFETYDRIPTAGITPPGTVISRLSIVSSANGVNVYVDEWENGYGFDPMNPNETADAKWTVSSDNTFGNHQGPALARGEVLTLTEAMTFATGSTGINAGDRIFISGAPVAVIRTVWPNVSGTESYIAGSWELYPTVAWESEYAVPVGEDITNAIQQVGRAAPNGGSYAPFQYTDVFITAAQDNTRILIDDPTIGGIQMNVVIDRGDNIRYEAANVGTTIRGEDASNSSIGRPIQAFLMTSSDTTYDMRFYTMTPTQYLGNEYYIPVPSLRATGLGFGDPGAGTVIETGAFIYSFDPANVIVIETATGTETMTLGLGEVGRFGMPVTTANGASAGPYAARIRTQDRTKKCWVLVAGHDDSGTLDWGAQALFTDYLSTEVFIPFAPANPVYLTPVDNNTQFLVDFDADGIPDDAFTLNRFDFRMVYDDTDNNPTGARISATGRFQAFWGQDHTQESPGEPIPDYDFGYTILPLFWNTPALTIAHDVTPTNLPAIGGSAVWSIVITAETNTVFNVDGEVTMPPGWEYVAGTTTITFSDGSSTITGPSADPGGGSGPTLFWLLDYDLAAGETITITYVAQTQTGLYVGGVNESVAQATGTSLADENDPNAFHFNPSDPAVVYITPESILQLTKVSDQNGLTRPGETITYTMEVTNVGSVAETNLVVKDPLPAGTTYVPNSTFISFPGGVGTFRSNDAFAASGSFNGSEGPQPWATSWLEGGENDGAGAGRVTVTSGDSLTTGAYLQITGGAGGERSAERYANLTGMTRAHLIFRGRRVGMEAGDNIAVEATSNGGLDWTAVATIPGRGQDDPDFYSYAYDVSAFASPQFGFRIRTSASFTDTNDIFRVDDAAIRAAYTVGTYVDDFRTQVYNGSYGSVNWASAPWVETDAGGGGATGGQVQVRPAGSGTPEIDRATLRVFGVNNSIYRPADLSGADFAVLTYDWRRIGLDSNSEFIAVDVSSNGGGSWTEIARYRGVTTDTTDAAYSSAGHDISAFATANFRLRFRANTGSLATGEGVHFDNVRISFLDSTAPTYPGGAPVDLVPAIAGYSLFPGQTMQITMQVVVDNPVAPGIVDITNIVSVTSDQTTTPLQAWVTDSLESCVALPTASPIDGRFLSIASNDLATLANERISFYLAALPGTTEIEFGIFDGDTGRGPFGAGDWTNGHWDYRSDQLVYRLYADPDKDGSTANLVGEWLGNDPNATSGSGGGSTWISDSSFMPDNAWWNCTFTTSATGEATSGNFFYRLDVEFENPASTQSWSNFKLRTDGFSISTAPAQILAFSSPIHTMQDFFIQYPNNNGVTDPGTPNYDGRWTFYVAEANPIDEFEVWNGDFDFGNWQGTSVDTDDPNTPNTVPSFATSPATLPEGAKGMGNPADNYSVTWRRIGGDIALVVRTPDGQEYVDTNPSGNGEWERFVLRTSSNGDEDLVATQLGAGAYQIRVTDLDIHNLTFLYFPHEMFACPTTPLNRIASGLSGRAFIDRDGDGAFGANDTPLAGAFITLRGTAGTGEPVSLTTKAGPDGRYAFVVAPGIYEVSTTYRLPSSIGGPRGAVTVLGGVRGAGSVLSARDLRLDLDDWRDGFDLVIRLSPGAIEVPGDDLDAGPSRDEGGSVITRR